MDVDPKTALEDLVERARLAAERMSVKNPTRRLLAEMATAIVAQARMLVDMQRRLADKPRIVLP